MVGFSALFCFVCVWLFFFWHSNNQQLKQKYINGKKLPQTIYLIYSTKTSELDYNIFVFPCDSNSILMA